MVALLREGRHDSVQPSRRHQSEESQRLKSLMEEAASIRKKFEKREITQDEAYRLLDKLRAKPRHSFFHRTFFGD